jgi:hypothetical protein
MRHMAALFPVQPYRPAAAAVSLRALLIFFTLVCVAVWYWYRVPFVREISQHTGGYYWKEASGRVEPGKEIQRYRRVLVGEPLREGRTELFDTKGNRIGEEYWREGALHGPWVRWYTTGRVRQTGEHSRGQKSGLWEQFDETGRPAARISYEEGQPHGVAEVFVHGEPFHRLQYEHGVVTQVAGRPFNDPLGRAFQKNTKGRHRRCLVDGAQPSGFPRKDHRRSSRYIANDVQDTRGDRSRLH